MLQVPRRPPDIAAAARQLIESRRLPEIARARAPVQNPELALAVDDGANVIVDGLHAATATAINARLSELSRLRLAPAQLRSLGRVSVAAVLQQRPSIRAGVLGPLIPIAAAGCSFGGEEEPPALSELSRLRPAFDPFIARAAFPDPVPAAALAPRGSGGIEGTSLGIPATPASEKPPQSFVARWSRSWRTGVGGRPVGERTPGALSARPCEGFSEAGGVLPLRQRLRACPVASPEGEVPAGPLYRRAPSGALRLACLASWEANSTPQRMQQRTHQRQDESYANATLLVSPTGRRLID